MSLPQAEKMTERQVEQSDSGTKELKESEEHPTPLPPAPRSGLSGEKIPTATYKILK